MLKDYHKFLEFNVLDQFINLPILFSWRKVKQSILFRVLNIALQIIWYFRWDLFFSIRFNFLLGDFVGFVFYRNFGCCRVFVQLNESFGINWKGIEIETTTRVWAPRAKSVQLHFVLYSYRGLLFWAPSESWWAPKALLSTKNYAIMKFLRLKRHRTFSEERLLSLKNIMGLSSSNPVWAQMIPIEPRWAFLNPGDP